MEQDELSEFLITRQGKKLPTAKVETHKEPEESFTREPLTTKNAVKFLLEGTLKNKTCRYCLNVTSPLYELDRIFEISGQFALYKVTVRTMIASFHPFKVADDPNFPDKICDKCLNRTLTSYLFTQQCEQSERALRNCFDDMYEKLEKLDPLEHTKKRGRQKLHPNYNVLYSEHKKVIDYAEPIINIVNIGSELFEANDANNKFECPRCWQVLPDVISLLNHEKIHPNSMWYNCRLCGKSFAKHNLLKRHIRSEHNSSDNRMVMNKGFKCADCGVGNESYDKHLQHIEKHKFQTVMQHLLDRNMDKLCSVCFNKDTNLVELDRNIGMCGGCPELTGQRTVYNILSATLPEMNTIHNYTGTKICEKCLNNALTAYIFLNHAHYVRNRLNTCINLMLNNLESIKPEGKVFIEISQNTILPPKEPDFDENLLIDNYEELDESELPIEVLEDEFRIESESDDNEDNTEIKTSPKLYVDNFNIKLEDCSNNYDGIYNDTKDYINTFTVKSEKEDCRQNNNTNKSTADVDDKFDIFDTIDNPSKKATKYYVNKKLHNGYQSPFVNRDKDKFSTINNVCSEFLTFKKRKKATRKYYHCKFTCPICSKHFLSEYFLERHILKHVNRKVECNKCLQQFKSKFHLYEHTKIVHLLNASSFWPCKTCGRRFLYKSKLLKHSKSHKKKECPLCEKFFTSQTYFNSHMQRHLVKLKVFNEKAMQTCSFCEMECYNDNSLSVHVNKVHLQIKPYSCDMCEQQFYTENNLNCHKKVHSLFSKEACQFCNKILKTRKSLVVHVRKHMGIRPHCCPLCGQAFYSQTKMKNHMKLNHGGKFCCKLCKSVFVNNTGLKDHVSKVHNMI